MPTATAISSTERARTDCAIRVGRTRGTAYSTPTAGCHGGRSRWPRCRYAYRTWLEAATLFDEAGEHDEAETSRGRANAMAERFRRDYWMEEADYPATGLDDDKRRVDSITSNAATSCGAASSPPSRRRRLPGA